jgi:hypothetical protein
MQLGVIQQGGHFLGVADGERLQPQPRALQAFGGRPVAETPPRRAHEEHLAADRPVAGSEEAAQRGDVARGDLGEHRLTGLHEAQGCPGEGQSPPSATGRFVDLDRHLDPPGETAPDGEQATAAVLVAAHAAPVPASPPNPRVAGLATGGQLQLRPVTATGSGEDHVERARRCSEALSELGEERCAHRRAHVIVGVQPGPDPVGVDVGGHQVVGGERDHRINRPCGHRQDLDDTVGRREAAGRRVGEDRGQPLLRFSRGGLVGGGHDPSLSETARPGAGRSEGGMVGYGVVLRRRR